jgi:hypothetical protein
MASLDCFREIWLADFEFIAPPGERPVPHCLVARELRSGRLIRLWADALAAYPEPPFPIREDCLFVAYYASAELGCFLALNWRMPARILDLFAEFRCLNNGLRVECGNGLLGALVHHGLPAMDGLEKESMRDLAIRGGPYTPEEQLALLDYCQADVDALARLLPTMLPKIDLPRALLRGRYMAAAARIEWAGVPIDVQALGRLSTAWDAIKAKLVVAVDADYGVFVPAGKAQASAESAPVSSPEPAYAGPLTFSAKRWGDYLARQGIPWPCLPSGALALDDDTFRDMAKAHPVVSPIRELRHSLSQLRLNDLAVGGDGRNRCILSTFQARTGRNQPSNAKFVFGPSVWLRCLIQPGTGMAVAYIDWSQQELAIAARLSNDERMQEAYRSGDFYLTFAKMARAVPPDATKQTHKAEREQFKTVALGVLYGLSADGLARKLGVPPCQGRELLRMHKETFPRFWAWSDAVEMFAMLHGYLETAFGWRVHVGPDTNPRSLRNFPMQAHGAEMLRLACCLATERGIKVCAPVHDALLVEGPSEQIEDVVSRTQQAMQEASEIVLPGFPLKSDAKIVRHPERYIDPRGEQMWKTVSRLLEEANPITQSTNFN